MNQRIVAIAIGICVPILSLQEPACDRPPKLGAEELGRAPLSNYGSLEPIIQQMRAHRPLDLNGDRWHKAHPRGAFAEWRDGEFYQRAQTLAGTPTLEPGTPGQRLEQLDRELQLADALEQLPEDYRDAIILRHVPLPPQAHFHLQFC
jgi:hypothetical protein